MGMGLLRAFWTLPSVQVGGCCPVPQTPAGWASRDAGWSCTGVTRFLWCCRNNFTKQAVHSSGNIFLLTASLASDCPPPLGGEGRKSEVLAEGPRFSKLVWFKFFFLNTFSLDYFLRYLLLEFAEWFISFENFKEGSVPEMLCKSRGLHGMQAGGNARRKALQVKINAIYAKISWRNSAWWGHWAAKHLPKERRSITALVVWHREGSSSLPQGMGWCIFSISNVSASSYLM